MIKECKHCGIDFDTEDPSKIEAGGLINECADCAEEVEVKYLGIQTADGKQQGIEVLAFSSEEDRKQFSQIWSKNIGMDKGKSSPLGRAGSTGTVKFKKVAEFAGNKNHKGRE